ncbi:MAG: hypothetical protein ACP5I8_03255 [Phycisphaerae bacterium]
MVFADFRQTLEHVEIVPPVTESRGFHGVAGDAAGWDVAGKFKARKQELKL